MFSPENISKNSILSSQTDGLKNPKPLFPACVSHNQSPQLAVKQLRLFAFESTVLYIVAAYTGSLRRGTVLAVHSRLQSTSGLKTTDMYYSTQALPFVHFRLLATKQLDLSIKFCYFGYPVFPIYVPSICWWITDNHMQLIMTQIVIHIAEPLQNIFFNDIII